MDNCGEDKSTVVENGLQDNESNDDIHARTGVKVTLYTWSGSNTDSELYWGSESAIWNNGGDTIIVTDGDGTVVLERSY